MTAKKGILKIYEVSDGGGDVRYRANQRALWFKAGARVRVSGNGHYAVNTCQCSVPEGSMLEADILWLIHGLFLLSTYHVDVCHISQWNFKLCEDRRLLKGFLSPTFPHPQHSVKSQQQLYAVQDTPHFSLIVQKRFVPFLVTLFWNKHDLTPE